MPSEPNLHTIEAGVNKPEMGVVVYIWKSWRDTVFETLKSRIKKNSN